MREPEGDQTQREVLEKVAQAICERRLAAPAIFMLESMKPLSFIASQGLVLVGPLLEAILPAKEYQTFAEAIEDRGNVEWLIRRLEEGEERGV